LLESPGKFRRLRAVLSLISHPSREAPAAIARIARRSHRNTNMIGRSKGRVGSFCRWRVTVNGRSWPRHIHLTRTCAKPQAPCFRSLTLSLEGFAV
jgi:hypothetical protein